MNHKSPLLSQMPIFMGLLTFVLTFFILSRTPSDADMWWHLRAGQVMWEQKSILLTDQFSYTRTGTPWVNAFWLAEIIFFLLYRLGGFFAISVFVAFMGGATFFLIYRRMQGNHLLNSAVILLAVLTAAPIWSPRPQLFSFFFLALLDKWLDEYRQGKFRRLWILIPFFALWSNVHGGWIWGFMLLLAYIAGEAVDNLFVENHLLKKEKWRTIGSLALWTAAGTLAIGLNPNGLVIWNLPFHTVDVSMQIQEWQSPDFHRIDFHPLLWMLFLLIVSARFSPDATRWSTLFTLIGFAYLTFVSQRNIAPFAIVAAPILAVWMNAAMKRVSSFAMFTRYNQPSPPLSPMIRTAANVVILLVLASTAIVRSIWLSTPDKVYQNYPVDAVQWIKSAQPEGNLFNSYNWGGYLTWALPEYPVFIDGRADLYGDELISEWMTIAQGTEEAPALLEKWDIRLIVLEPQQPLIGVLEEKGWRMMFRAENCVILAKDSP